MNRSKRQESEREDSALPHENGGASFSAKFYSFLYRTLPHWLTYRMLSSGVPDTRYWGEPGPRRLAGSTSRGGSSV